MILNPISLISSNYVIVHTKLRSNQIFLDMKKYIDIVNVIFSKKYIYYTRIDIK